MKKRWLTWHWEYVEIQLRIIGSLRKVKAESLEGDGDWNKTTELNKNGISRLDKTFTLICNWAIFLQL